MPEPNEDETRQEFVQRCIPIVIDDGTAEGQDQAVAVCNSMWEQAHEAKSTDADEEWLITGSSTKAEGEREKLQKARDARARRYGIGAKEGGALTPPAGYPSGEGDYGDPVNYRYPIDADHITPAVQYFNHDGQREKGGYSSAEWSIVGKRIAARAAGKEYKGGKVVDKKKEKALEDVDDITPPMPSLAIKMVSENETGAIVTGPLLLWGDEGHKDLQGEYFTPDTALWLERYKSAPALFHHGLDGTVGLSVIGHRVKAEVKDGGVWVQDWLDKSNQYWKMIKPLLDAEALYYSPGSAPHLVKSEDDGRLLSFPVVEDTLTVIPAQHRLRPVEQIKAAYKAANLELPEIDTSTGDDDPSGDTEGSVCEDTSEAEIERLRAENQNKLAMIKLEV